MISVSVFAILGYTIKSHISFYIGLLESCLGVGEVLGPLTAEYIEKVYTY